VNIKSTEIIVINGEENLSENQENFEEIMDRFYGWNGLILMI